MYVCSAVNFVVVTRNDVWHVARRDVRVNAKDVNRIYNTSVFCHMLIGLSSVSAKRFDRVELEKRPAGSTPNVNRACVRLFVLSTTPANVCDVLLLGVVDVFPLVLVKNDNVRIHIRSVIHPMPASILSAMM